MSDAEKPSVAQTIRTLVVDDERLARAGMRKMLSFDAELDVVECAGGAEAIRAIRSGSVDLVFLDIQMRDVDGFDVIETVGADRMPVVVFTTAYSAHAIRAFEACALDYLLKPVGEERLAQAVARAKANVRQRRLGAMSEQLIALLGHGVPTSAPLSAPTAHRFAIRSGQSMFYLDASDVDWIESADNYARVWTHGRSHLVRESLNRLEETLRTQDFVRVHRTALVNVARVREIRGTAVGRHTVVLADGTRVVVSRERRATVQHALRDRARR